MPRNRIISFVLISLFFYNQSFSQEKDSLNKVRVKIYDLICKADGLLIDLKYMESLQVSKQALNLAYKNKQYDYVAMSYNTIAGCHEELLNTKMALAYYNKALQYSLKTKNDTIKDWIHNNIGNIYNFVIKDYDKGIYHYKKSLQYANKGKDTTEIIFTEMNLAWAYFNKKDFEQGYPYVKDVEKHLDKYGDIESRVIVNNLLGMYYSNKGDARRAGFYFRTAIDYGIRYKQQNALADAYAEYSKHLYEIKDYKNAYLNKVNYEKLKDDLHNHEKMKSAQIAGVQIELDESRRKIDKIELEKYAQQENLKNSKIIVILFLAILIILLLLLYTFYKNSIYRKKVNQQLLESNAELKIAKDKAEESSKLKSQFISTVTHELRTPLYGVIGVTNLILDEHKELENSPHINSLKFSARYLLSLVNDLLQIHKIEDKKIVLEELPLNIMDEIEKVKEALQFIAIKNKNKVLIDVGIEIPEYLIGDKLRLSQILVNLTSNALKFTQNGTIRLTAALVKKVGNIHHVKFEIVDNGCGIAIENQNKIFEKFVQIDRKEGDYQGTGLGLSIVKRLLELLGSTIQLQSKEGEGTTVTFTIPFEYDANATKSYIENIDVDTTNSSSYKILVVEDNKINQMVTKKIIEKNNYKCVVVDDGYAALEILDKENFDAILMDINMPVINGFETTRMIRDKGIDIPIIALTAFDKDEITDEAKLSGMDDILIKPFEPLRLFQIINSQIAKHVH
ncbi:MAG: response regulator [Flavobacterium lindanitolerans]|uniref:ATP-binding protein n=1 Tax=Flavobacterium lindanitolerans TaxID=428988 RepID=UPI001A389C75|nr:ATP-binding protein [Flavobacterium lindanitolerans]MBL7868701.1 response regulator [Flavobacterium lindanitolerans]